MVAVLINLLPEDAGSAATPKDFSQVTRFVFIPSRTAPVVTVIDADSDRVAGMLDSIIVPGQIIVSEAAKRLVAMDGVEKHIAILDLASGNATTFDLAFTPRRLVAASDGYMIAAADLAGGTIGFVDLMHGRVTSLITGLSEIRDLMFGADGAFLYVAADGLKGLGVVDVARGKLIEDIAIPDWVPGNVSGLTRAPNGRAGYLKAQDGLINVIDLNNFRLLRRVEAAQGAPKVFPTGFGRYLVVPNNADHTLTVLANASLSIAAMMNGPSDMATVYSGWFDTAALVPSPAERKLLIYDLDRLALAASISLPGRPGLGAVTPDGAKFYLVLEDSGSVAVFDLKTRRLTKSIPVGPDPGAAVMAKSFDICH